MKGEKVRRNSRLVSILLLVGFGALLAAAAAFAARSASDTIVFGTDADPALMDPSLVSDGPSLRATDQIFESLVGFKPGGTRIVPELALSWKPSKNGLSWTFKLRKNVKFSDGTAFNAAAVCTNFSRWYNFPGPLQNAALSYYWNTVFGGFAHPAQGSAGPDKSLYKGCKTHGQYSVSILLTRPSSSFLAAIGLPNFGIASPAALQKYDANGGTVDANGVFHPTGTFATRNPVGTGPYVLSSWTIGSKLELAPNPRYWGKKAILKRVIFRPIGDTAARLQALQTGELQGMDGVDPADYKTVQGNSKFKLLKRPTFSVGYVGINQSIAPMNKPLVRQALAYALDRKSVATFYAGNGQVANQFLPPALFGYAKKGVPTYTYNPTKAKQLLQQAGETLPVKVDFYYPTNVSRPYMPDPKRNAEAFGASMEKAGFQVTFHSSPWRPDYRAGVQAGKYQLFLFGWIADFADPADFLNVHFGQYTPQFGFRNQKLFTELQKADAESDEVKRTALYQQASIDVMKYMPVVPYVWAGSGVALDSNVKGYVPGPIGPVNEPFSLVSIGS
jgi:peptide/nickel transport system substrate-binding protein